LKGLTWDHPRGYAPLIAGAQEYEQQHPGIRIQWDRRSLRDFGEAPIEQYVNGYDLLIVDHPFVGFAARHDVLVDLADGLSEAEKTHLANDSVGPSWQSYWYDGGLWALPIDAATQVASYRPDLLARFRPEPPQSLDEVFELGKELRAAGQFVIVPACPTDAISLFFTLSANLGFPVEEASEVLVNDLVARQVFDRLHKLISIAHPRSLDWNPIQVYDFMVSGGEAVYCPYGFGYSNYSRAGRRPRLKFTNAPAAGPRGCGGTMLGGTGVAVSQYSAHQPQAIAYAKWLVSEEHQRGTYFRGGGQPASLAAWTDRNLDDAAGGFFSGTLRTLQTAYVRPRFSGFVTLFEAAGRQINRCLRGELGDRELVEWLNASYRSRRSSAQPGEATTRRSR
jgi:multiple sugar transport system substrate-binding protein